MRKPKKRYYPMGTPGIYRPGVPSDLCHLLKNAMEVFREAYISLDCLSPGDELRYCLDDEDNLVLETLLLIVTNHAGRLLPDIKLKSTESISKKAISHVTEIASASDSELIWKNRFKIKQEIWYANLKLQKLHIALWTLGGQELTAEKKEGSCGIVDGNPPQPAKQQPIELDGLSD
jgi:hypothetical protein